MKQQPKKFLWNIYKSSMGWKGLYKSLFSKNQCCVCNYNLQKKTIDTFRKVGWERMWGLSWKYGNIYDRKVYWECRKCSTIYKREDL